jgi:hypothetical protein
VLALVDDKVGFALVGSRAARPDAAVAGHAQVVRLEVVPHGTESLEYALAVTHGAPDARCSQAMHKLVLLQMRLELEALFTNVASERPDLHLQKFSPGGIHFTYVRL